MLKIALPNKGSLSEDAVRLVSEAGYKCKRYGRELVVYDKINDVEFYFLRPRDIAVYVGNGLLDMGITGRDLMLESNIPVDELLPLGFGKSSFYYAAPANQNLSFADFNGKRIASSYTTIVNNDLKKRGLNSKVIKLDGAVEISIKLGVADIIADVVQSGKTIEEAGLKLFKKPIMNSEAILVALSDKIKKNKAGNSFIKRIKGIIVAREYVMVEYDIKKDNLENACEVTPGIEAPTVAQLADKNWVAVKSMIKQKEINIVIDQLAEIGAKAIIVTNIKTCRM